MKNFNFKYLFIYDLANNHQGSVEHGCNIINQVGRISREMEVRAALKFQFRQLDTFIHPAYQKNDEIKFIKRFRETKLSVEEFKHLTKKVKENELLTMCTPFDESSVDIICEMDIDLIKIASASADDFPLLKKVTKSGKPVVVSTGGLRLDQIDSLVSFLETSDTDFALMHCVAIYPTPNERLNLNQISLLKERYPHIPIGFSTHEDQNNIQPIQIAYAKGAELFERHVGVETDTIKLNTYSSTPEQLKNWLKAFREAEIICGPLNRVPSPIEEIETLTSLKRGIYLNKNISKGQKINENDIYFAMPVQANQMISALWHDGIIADKNYEKNEALDKTADQNTMTTKDEIIYQIMLQVKSMLSKAKISINKDASIEISHHYGLNRFREFGAVIITCINRTYAKKYVILLSRQKHPYHFHKIKEETFQLIHGDLEIEKNGTAIQLQLGDTCIINPNDWHKFHTLKGAIFEEISTTHYKNDSYYEDPHIAKLNVEDRKTKVDLWINYFRKHNEI